MSTNHKHKGVESNGNLKSHPVSRKHKDKKVQKWHLKALDKLVKGITTKSKTKKSKGKKSKKSKEVIFHKLEESMPTDADGYLAVDLKKIKAKGIRILNVTAGKVMFAEKGKVRGIQVDK